MKAKNRFWRIFDSVARQTYKGVEHIIVDGASKDETVDMAEKYKEQSDQADNGHEVRILSEPDKGLYDAMNKGLRMATGDIVGVLNSDDLFYDNRGVLTLSIAAVPEPESFAMMLAGLALVAGIARRRASRS